MARLFGYLGLALISMMSLAEARVTRIEVARQELFAAGQTFGEVGAYEKVVGRFHGELDPAHPLNAAIVDLDKAPRNARGMVEYSADFYILKPVDIAKGNGAIFYEANNRGSKSVLARFNNGTRSNDPSTAEHAGNGFLMRHGFTVVWNGWMPGVAAENNLLRIEIPSAPGLEQTVWDEFLFNDKTTKTGRLTYRTTTTDKAQAMLLVRDRNADEPAVVAPEQWEFVDARTVRLLPEGTPFRMGAIYQLIYKAANPPVNGIGFASTRDFISFLRTDAADENGTANPLAPAGRPAISRALAYGNSQTARYLRDLIYNGFNEDEANRIVFDGTHTNVAGGRTFLNYRFGQPNRIVPAGHGFMAFPGATFPFAFETQTDPFTGKSDGNFARCQARGNCPKLINTLSSTEYWQGGQSLLTTDPLGRSDGTPPESVRIYHFSGTQHGGIEGSMAKGVCAMPSNQTDYRPFLRALIVALDRWVKDGAVPPASRYPHISDGTLIETVAFAPVPGLTAAKGPSARPRIDYGPHFDKGILGPGLPVERKESYRVLVPSLDADGNELGGLRLPAISVPTGTAAGWNVRAPGSGAAGELCYLEGSFIAFPRTKAEREASGDPRPSLQERYRDGADYAQRVRQAAAALEKEGYLLPEDVKRIVDKATTMTW